MAPAVHQLSVKLYARGVDRVDPDHVIRAFHSWIQTSALDALGELPIDVTDYSHVPRGPGVLLIAYGAQIGVDESDGRWGLAYRRKRDEPGPIGEKLLDALGRALAVARLAQQTAPLAGELPIGAGELWVRIHTRLLGPSTSATYEALRGEIARALEPLYGAPVAVTQQSEPGELFGARVRASSEPGVEELLARLARSAG